MDIWGNHKTALGYETNNGGVDSYGVDHSGFSLRDELEYQFARSKREQELVENYNKQGITENYPQFDTNFWGGTSENNYGFGTSNIKQNIENVTNRLNNSGWNSGLSNGQGFGNMAQQNNNLQNSMQQNSIFDNIKNTASNMWQNIKDGATIAADTIRYTPEALGELAADTKIAYDYWQKMNQTGNQLVKTLGSGQGADIDNYYHPLLQCELAKISPQSRDNGIALGYAKEYLMDYPKKRFLKHQSHSEIMKDSRKDLQNNLYGSNLGYNNPNRSCEDLLDDRRTPNMRKLGIR